MIKKISLVLYVLIISSCSTEVSKSQAASLFNTHFDKEPYYNYVRISKGLIEIKKDSKKDNLKLGVFKNLETEGLIKLNRIESTKSGSSTFYKIHFLDKSNKYIVDLSDKKQGKDHLLRNTIVKLISAEWKFDKVIDIENHPKTKGANATVLFKKTNANPFDAFAYNTSDTEREESIKIRLNLDNQYVCCD
ncbi:hypothetical protein GCM10022393_26690 [Aquimarina addita]|uniref:Lipoprotein n=1 Tax=Aquimarina addita TaxID=870485 RepID=A0ABP6ULK7_9FLAO